MEIIQTEWIKLIQLWCTVRMQNNYILTLPEEFVSTDEIHIIECIHHIHTSKIIRSHNYHSEMLQEYEI